MPNIQRTSDTLRINPHQPDTTFTSPRVYRLKLPWRLVFWIPVPIAILVGWMSIQSSNHIWIRCLMALMAVLILCTPLLARMRLILEEHRIGIVYPGGTRWMAVEDIHGYRFVNMQHFQNIVLLPEGGRPRKREMLKYYFRLGEVQARVLEIPTLFALDHAFQEWLSQFTNLDARDAQVAEQKLLEDEALGTTTDERAARLTWATRVARVFSAVSITTAFWLLLFPVPYTAALLAVAVQPVAVFGLVRRWKGLFTVNDRKRQRNLNIPLLMPGFAIAIRALSDVQLVAWRPLLWPSLVATGVVLGAAWIASQGQPRSVGTIVSLALLLPAYPFALVPIANRVLDRSPAEVMHAEVLDKHVSRDKGGSHYILGVGGWGSLSNRNKVEVSAGIYGDAAPGKAVSIDLHRGFFGAPWFEVTDVDPLGVSWRPDGD